jgi:hypothetical protein
MTSEAHGTGYVRRSVFQQIPGRVARWPVFLAALLALAPPTNAWAQAPMSLAIGGTPPSVVAGTTTPFTVSALDGAGNLATSYRGTVRFDTNYPNTTIPANYTFTSADGGSHTFSFTPRASGSHFLAVTDTTNPGLYAAVDVAVTASTGAIYVISNLTNGAPLNAGVPAPFDITAYDAFYNVATGYNGFAVITSSDPAATLPPQTRLSGGSVTGVTITFNTAGASSVTATDSTNATMTDTAWALIDAAPVSTITAPAFATAGVAGLPASVPSQSGVTYSWSITNGSITAGSGTNAITFTAGVTGLLGLQCRVTRTAGGASSTGSRNVTVVDPPTQPTITAQGPVTAGATGRTASVTAKAGMTYAWTIVGGTITSPGGTAGVTSGGVNRITYTAGAIGSITFTCTENNAAGSVSAAGRATVQAIAAPAQPTITARSPVNVGDTGLTGSVVAHAGMTYLWTIANGTITSPGGTSGVTSSGVNSITYNTVSAGTLTLTCVEINAAGTASSPATSNIAVTGMPVQPTISTVTSVAANATGVTASVTANSGMTYRWTITNGTITSAGGTSGVTSGGRNTIIFTAGSSGSIGLTAVEINSAGTSSAPGTATISITPSTSAQGHLYFVAHQDDDLLFENPPISTSIKSGRPTRVVFLTAAGGPDPASWQAREHGVYTPYLTMANAAFDPYADSATYWTCGAQPFAGRNVRVCSLTQNPLVSVVFLRLPDGSLSSLWSKTYGPPFYVTPVTSLTSADGANTYSRQGLLDTLAAIMNNFQPLRIGVQDNSFAYGDDHADHISGGLFALLASHTYSLPHELKMYRGYSMAGPWYTIPMPEVQNLSAAEYADKHAYMVAYGGGFPNGSDYDNWSKRHYAISRLVGTGALVEPGGNCVDSSGGQTADGTATVLATCSGLPAQRWSVTTDSFIRGPASKCLTVAADGISVVLSSCIGTPAQKWTLMSNGQVRGNDAACLSVGADGSTLQVGDCQADTSASLWKPLSSQTWTMQLGATSGWSLTGNFTDADVTASTASVRLADVNGDGYADACVRLSTGLYCALNNRSGGFSAYSLFSSDFSDAAGYGSVQYGSTLQFADLNGDGKADVCARSASGIVCALADASGTSFGPASLWSANFSDASGFGALASYFGSIRLADVNGDGKPDVCGRGAAGIFCALNTGGSAFSGATLFSADFSDAAGWQPSSFGTTIQFGDVNGDGKADVCGRSANGIQCAIANSTGSAFINTRQWSLRSDFTDASGWGSALSYYGSIRIVDVNGDGYADVCGRSPGGVVCGYSNGVAFDRAAPLVTSDFTDALGWLPSAYGATLQFGDLNNSGKADACARRASGLVCTNWP